MPRIQLFGIGQASRSPYVTAKQAQNMYMEVRPQGEKSSLVAYGSPGLSAPFTDFGATPCRGGLEFEGTSLAYVVHRGVFWEVNNAGVRTNRGALLTTTGRVSMSDNGVQIMIVDGTYGYIFNTVTLVFAQIVDVDFPANPLTVTFLGGRFIINLFNSGRFYCSDLYNGLSWDALNFANAETSPDPIVAVWANNGQLALFGTRTTEYWGNSGTLDFPYALIAGTAKEWGLAATWSLAKFDNSCAGLFKNRMGQVLFCKISGYEPTPISTVDMDAIINDYASTTDCTAYSYLLSGHPMYVVSFPSAGFSWAFDGTTGFWSKRKSYGLTRYRGEFSFPFLGEMVVADYNDGKLYRIDPNALTDNGDPIEREIIGETIRSEDGDFVSYDSLRVDMEVGVGLPGVPHPYFSINYLSLAGAVGDYAHTPDSAALDIVGDIDIQFLVARDDWQAVAAGTIVSKWLSAGNQRSYHIYVAVGCFFLVTSIDGTSFTQVTYSLPFTETLTNGDAYWYRVTLDVDNGAGGKTASLYSSADGLTWTLVTAVTSATPISIFNSTALLNVGAYEAGASLRFTGKIYQVSIYNGIGGTLAAKFRASDASVGAGPVVSATTGETYTLAGTATIASEATETLGTGYVVPATPGANPQISLSISRDNGKTWGADTWKPIGPMGEYPTVVEWRRLGTSMNFVPKLKITDPVRVCIVSASLNPRT